MTELSVVTGRIITPLIYSTVTRGLEMSSTGHHNGEIKV